MIVLLYKIYICQTDGRDGGIGMILLFLLPEILSQRHIQHHHHAESRSKEYRSKIRVLSL